MSADEETVELLAALVDTSAALKGDGMLSLDGPGAAFHSGVGEPENALGIGETWASFDVAAPSRVFLGFPGAWVSGAGVAIGDGVGETFGVSGAPPPSCCDQELVKGMGRPYGRTCDAGIIYVAGLTLTLALGVRRVSVIS